MNGPRIRSSYSLSLFITLVGNKPSDANSSEERQMASKWLKTRQRPDEDCRLQSWVQSDRVPPVSAPELSVLLITLCYNRR